MATTATRARNVRLAVRNNVYIANYPLDIHEDELKEYFATFGAVERISIIRDRETRSAY
jgi:RNA recognition motif-containing protein